MILFPVCRESWGQLPRHYLKGSTFFLQKEETFPGKSSKAYAHAKENHNLVLITA